MLKRFGSVQVKCMRCVLNWISRSKPFSLQFGSWTILPFWLPFWWIELAKQKGRRNSDYYRHSLTFFKFRNVKTYWSGMFSHSLSCVDIFCCLRWNLRREQFTNDLNSLNVWPKHVPLPGHLPIKWKKAQHEIWFSISIECQFSNRFTRFCSLLNSQQM